MAVTHVQADRILRQLVTLRTKAKAVVENGIFRSVETGSGKGQADNESDGPQIAMTNLTPGACRLQGPAAELTTALAAVAPGKALDIAAGAGRHAAWLGERGWQVTAVDRVAGAASPGVTWVARDLEAAGLEIAEGSFDGIVCWLYWQADLLPGIARGVRPGGVVALAGKLTGRFATSLEAWREAFPRWEELGCGEDGFKAWLIARKPVT